MCSIVGALFGDIEKEDVRYANLILSRIWYAAHARGRDGRGYVVDTILGGWDGRSIELADMDNIKHDDAPQLPFPIPGGTMVGNLRAEPTTEYVKNKSTTDQQPYQLDEWTVVHNGTVANDKTVRTYRLSTAIDSAAIAELLAVYTPPVCQKTRRPDFLYPAFRQMVDKLVGSFAILATHASCTDRMFIAANYRPIWYVETPYGVFFASSRDALPDDYAKQMWEPYRAGVVTTMRVDGVCKLRRLRTALFNQPLLESTRKARALVVCSGGLDSVVAATWAKNEGYEIELLNFLYGSRAQTPERVAIVQCANALDVPYTLKPLPVYEPGDSPLLRADAAVAGGEQGAEFAHEWVPARNLLLLAVATAYAEAHNFDFLVLGNNLEEAGAYPDNEPEFIDRFNDLLPFAVGDGKRLRVLMPVGNMMKHEIVALGHKLGAPMEHTWSCYRAGTLHCGTCGPCYMRRKAFEINNLDEVIDYEN